MAKFEKLQRAIDLAAEHFDRIWNQDAHAHAARLQEMERAAQSLEAERDRVGAYVLRLPLAVLPKTLLEAGEVVRYHTNPAIARLGQTDAHHSWGVAAIIGRFHPDPSAALLKEAIFHDAGEVGCFDVHGLIKAANPEIARISEILERRTRIALGVPPAALSEDERAWLKFADNAEAVAFVRRNLPHVLKGDGWPEQEAAARDKGRALGLSDADLDFCMGVAS